MSKNKNFLNEIGKAVFKQNTWWGVKAQQPFDDFVVSDSLALKLNIPAEQFLEVVLPECKVNLFNSLDYLLQEKNRTKRFSMGFNINNSSFWLMNELNVLEMDGVEFIYASCIDVTEMHEIETQLVSSQSQLIIEQLKVKEEQAKKEKEILAEQYRKQTKFLAMLSHELRSPLLGLGGLIEIVKKDCRLQDTAQNTTQEHLKVMKFTVDQMNFLINDILVYSQTQNEQLKLNPSEFKIADLAVYVKHLTKSIAGEKGVFVTVQVINESESFFGDLVRISQILINLVVNAVKFTQVGGVGVVLEEKASCLVLEVSDTGEGMGASELNNIFEAFRQLDSKGGQLHLGSGLGLTVVKTLVTLLHGDIKVSSIKGEGTTFSVTIPLEAIECKKVAKPIPNSNPLANLRESAEPIKVLIADDSAINRKVLELFLLEAGCAVEHAEDGLQAFQLFETNDYDFIFLDIQMPKLNGVEVCQKIRSYLARNSNHKTLLKGILALTAAHTVEEIAEMGIEVDKKTFDEWIEKPISQDKVIQVLDQYCSILVKPKEKIPAKNFKKDIKAELTLLIPDFITALENSLVSLNLIMQQGSQKEFNKELHSMKGNLMLFSQERLLEKIQVLSKLDLNVDNRKLISLIDDFADEIKTMRKHL